jgi:hypothetical protein
MADKTKSERLLAFMRRIGDDWKGTFRQFPDQTAMALQDDNVLEALEKRFAAEANLRTVRALNYDFYSGLHNLIFEFAPGAATLDPSSADAFLTIMDAKGKVIAVVDPFDSRQPNKFVPPLPEVSEQPFVLERPSVAQGVRLSAEQLYPAQVRSRAFFERLQGGGAGVIPIDLNHWTYCSYQTWTPYGSVLDTVIDDCGQEPWILA